MSYKKFSNIIRVQGSMAYEGLHTKLGIITGINPAQYSVKVTFIPDGTETGWIPLMSPWVGNGWGMFCPPSMSDQVEVHFQDGGQNAPICGMRLYDAKNAPLDCPSGEFWLVHQSGSFFKLVNTGEIQVNGNCVWTGDTTQTGNFTASENLSCGNGATGSFTTPTGLTVEFRDGICTNIY